MGVVPTTIAAPRHVGNLIVRRGLSDQAGAIDASRVVLVCAPAGYGKTTALRQMAQEAAARGRPVLWLSARAGLSTLADFTEALDAAMTAAGLDEPSTADSDNRLLMRLALRRDRRPVLCVDDAQLLSPDVLALLAQILASARDELTTIIVSRLPCPLPLARMRSQGFLLEICANDLAFTIEEIAEYVAASERRPVDIKALEALLQDTAGWPTGVGRVCAACSAGTGGRDAELLLRESAAYFDEEVLKPQTEAVRAFIFDTVVLEVVTADACVALTGREEARTLLATAADLGVFLERLPTYGEYRYHPLFRQVVLRRVQERDALRLAQRHRQASVFFADRGDRVRAIDHARLSGDTVFLADQLEALTEQLVYDGFLYMVDQVGSALSESLVADRPHLALALAWKRIRSLAYSKAERLIQMAEAVARAEAAKDENDRALDVSHLNHIIRHRRIMLDVARDDMAKVERPAELLLAEFGDDEPYLSCSILAQVMSARRELFHFQDIMKLEAEARRALDRPGSNFAAIPMKSSIAPTLAAVGKVDAARAMLEDALAMSRTLPAGTSGLSALPGLPLAELHYDLGEFAEARALIDENLSAARSWGFVDQLAAGYIIQARLLATEGDLQGADKVLDEAHLLALEHGLDRLRAYVVGEQVRILIRNGDPLAAERAFRAGGLEPAGDPFPTLEPTRQSEAIAIAWLRVQIQKHNLAAARNVAKRWFGFAKRNGAVRSGVIFELLLAKIAVLSGDLSEARRAIRGAVTLAAPAGWTQVFLDEGDAIGSLLIEAYTDAPSSDDLADRFARRLVSAFTGAPPLDTENDEIGLGNRLLNREVEILKMVAAGLRNREIGNRVGLTEGTVKWYMQQIYDKLGVRRRPQAVMRARQLGLLSEKTDHAVRSETQPALRAV